MLAGSSRNFRVCLPKAPRSVRTFSRLEESVLLQHDREALGHVALQVQYTLAGPRDSWMGSSQTCQTEISSLLVSTGCSSFEETLGMHESIRGRTCGYQIGVGQLRGRHTILRRPPIFNHQRTGGSGFRRFCTMLAPSFLSG